MGNGIMIKRFRQIIDLRKKDYQIIHYQRPSLAKMVLRGLGNLTSKANRAIDRMAVKLDDTINSIQPKIAIATIVLSCVVMVIFTEPIAGAMTQTGLTLAESLIVRPIASGITL